MNKDHIKNHVFVNRLFRAFRTHVEFYPFRKIVDYMPKCRRYEEYYLERTYVNWTDLIVPYSGCTNIDLWWCEFGALVWFSANSAWFLIGLFKNTLQQLVHRSHKLFKAIHKNSSKFPWIQFTVIFKTFVCFSLEFDPVKLP